MNDTDAKSRILQAATRLFGLRGYGGTSVSAVVAAAGVTKPTLYYYFASKEALYTEAVERHVTQARTRLEALLDEAHDLRSVLEAFVRAFVDNAMSDLDGVRLLMRAFTRAVHGAEDDDEPAIDMPRLHQQTLDILVRCLLDARVRGEVRDDVDLGAAALAVVGACDMHIMGLLHGMSMPEDYAQRLTRILLHGVSSS